MATSTEWANAARLVRRAGFGATGASIDEALKLGAGPWLAASLRDPGADPGALATPAPALSPFEALAKDASLEQRKARQVALAAQDRELGTWWLRRMIAVHNPVVEKLTFGWHNHFATSADKVRVAKALANQNESLRAGGRGSFTALANAMLTDAAMVRWLDADTSTVGSPNENLSREFLELFTLGHGGGYTEQDVREGARALTGWTIAADGSTKLVAKRHDSGVKTVLGRTGPLDAAGFVEAALSQPGSPAYLASRWWGQLVSPDPPPPDALARIVTAYGPGRDLGAMFTAILLDPHVSAEAGTLVVSPVEWLVGAARSLRIPSDETAVAKLLPYLRALGQVPFYPPSVAGWPSGRAWLSTAAAATRMDAANALTAQGDLGDIAAAAPQQRLGVLTYRLGIPSLSARTAAALNTLTGDPKQLVAAALVSPEYLAN